MRAPLAGLGLSYLAADRIRRLAQAVTYGSIRFDLGVAFDELIGSLTHEADLDLPSAHWVAMRSLGEPDASPFGAPAVLTPTAQLQLDATAQEAWRPWRSYAAVLLALQAFP
jgi:AraC family transcriptional regulator of adaptative response / DNA-3-methyladenine glycosylase II